MCEQREVISPSGIIQLNVKIPGRRHKKANKLCLSPPPEECCLLLCGFKVLRGEDEHEAGYPLWAELILQGCVEQLAWFDAAG